MTSDEILQGNKIIAEFDGIKLGVSLYSWRIGCTEPIQEGHLNYHASWRWLMSVVEKIESLPADSFHGMFGVYISGNDCIIQGTKLRTEPENFHPAYHNGYTLETKILSTWYAVVQFIKWYNEK